MAVSLTVSPDEVLADPGRLAILVPAEEQHLFLTDPEAIISDFTPWEEQDRSTLSPAVRNTLFITDSDVAMVLLARWLRDVMPAPVEFLAQAGLCAVVPTSPGGMVYQEAVEILEVRIGSATALRIHQPDSYGDPTAHLLVDPGMESTWTWMGPKPTAEGAELTAGSMDLSEMIAHDPVMRRGIRATVLYLLRAAARDATTSGPRPDHDPTLVAQARWMVGVLDQYED